MSKYIKDDLLVMEQPYEKLIMDGDSISESHEELEKLSRKEKIALITKMLLQCPHDSIELFRTKIAILENKEANEKCFHAIAKKALQVHLALFEILNPDNSQPYNLFLQDSYDADLFNQFHQLSQAIVDENATVLASVLANTTPAKKVNQLILNVRAAFSDTKFLESLRQALVLKHQLDSLNGDKPHEVFTSYDFNPSLFHKFPTVVSCQLAHKQDAIAKKLADAPQKYYSHIGRQLEALTSVAHDSSNFFREINGIFSGIAENQQHSSRMSAVSVGKSSDNIFSENARRIGSEKIEFKETTEELHLGLETPKL